MEANSGRIVVGVDGSEESKAALRWAYEEAERSDACLEVVHAWTLPVLGDFSGMAARAIGAYRLAAEELLSHVIADTIGEPSDVKVLPTVVENTPAAALIDIARGADLLVVGSRGLGGFRGLLLGSVSQACTHHAPCPVAIIRGI